MSHYQGSVPDTEPARAWLAKAACIGHADLMFPDNSTAGNAKAKQICRGCSVWRACLLDALDTGDNQHGIRGGMRPDERRAVARKMAAGDTATVTPPKPSKPRKPQPKTLAEAFRQHTRRTKDGHILWNGITRLQFQGRRYTAWQAAFIVGHGREPEGLVRSSCGKECFRREHLTDAVLRDEAAECGTRAGYWRHRKHGEDACPPCKQANSEYTIAIAAKAAA